MPSPCLSRATPLLLPRTSLDPRGDEEDVRFNDGRMSFFCFDAGRISSRSTGTPRETRNRRRVRERIQSGGARGGGATSCDQRDAERGLIKTEESLGSTCGVGMLSISGGYKVLIKSSVALSISSWPRSSKSGTGCQELAVASCVGVLKDSRMRDSCIVASRASVVPLPVPVLVAQNRRHQSRQSHRHPHRLLQSRQSHHQSHRHCLLRLLPYVVLRRHYLLLFADPRHYLRWWHLDPEAPRPRRCLVISPPSETTLFAFSLGFGVSATLYLVLLVQSGHR